MLAAILWIAYMVSICYFTWKLVRENDSDVQRILIIAGAVGLAVYMTYRLAVHSF